MTTEPTAFDQLLSVLAAAGFEPVPAPRTYTREDLIRAIVAQQWAVAIALLSPWAGGWWILFGDCNANVAELPCAVDVVDGKEGAL
jgi:hypothetical protein